MKYLALLLTQLGSFPNTLTPQVTLKDVEYQTFVTKDPIKNQDINFQDRNSSGISSELNFATTRFNDRNFDSNKR